MPSGSKKRKAAKKKKEQATNNTNSSTNNNPHGNGDQRSQDERESDGGDVGSPASQGDPNHQHPFNQREEEGKRGASPVQSHVTEDKSVEEANRDAESSEISRSDDVFAVKVEDESGPKEDLESTLVTIRHIKHEKSSSSSSSRSSSDDESQASQKNSKGEAHNFVSEGTAYGNEDKLATVTSEEFLKLVENEAVRNVDSNFAVETANVDNLVKSGLYVPVELDYAAEVSANKSVSVVVEPGLKESEEFIAKLPLTMAATTANTPLHKPSPLGSSSKSSIPISKSVLHFRTIPRKLTPPRSLSVSSSLSQSNSTPGSTASAVTPTKAPTHDFISRYAPDEPRKGADILVEALEREGVKDVFAYPGGASVEIHQALTRSKLIRNILPRHEQGGVFAAEGYARSSRLAGVCIATSGPGATNLVSGLADAMIDSIPLVAITGQVPRRMIGTDAFQETPIVEVTRSITKHNYLVLDIDDIPRIVSEAFFLATSGRPGPVLIDIPKDIQQQLAVPNWNQPFRLSGYMSRLPKEPNESLLEQIVRLVFESKKPVLYVGGGCLNSNEELKRFVELTGIPVTTTLMGLGSFPSRDPLSLQMLGMHGTVYANYAVDKSDLLLAFGVRFDDRVTGKLEAFANRAKIVHIDIDSAEIGKNKQPHVSVCSDVKLALKGINKILESKGAKVKLNYSAWRNELNEQKVKYPLNYKTFGEAIPPQYAIQVLDELTDGNAIISTGVGQHQMWAAQFYKYKKPRQWLTSGGLGAMGFGLPAAIGAAVANPGSIVVDIDGDGSFMMNVQELATIRVENLPIKILLLNNQHLGMVVQWEDRFYKANRAHTYLGNPSDESEIFPNMLKFAEACGIPAARVTKKEDLRQAIQKMLETPGPYLLDVIVPHQEHVLPMIPGGGAFKDVITDGDGRTKY